MGHLQVDHSPLRGKSYNLSTEIDHIDSRIKMLFYNIKEIEQQGITITEGEWGCQNRGIFCVTMLVFSLVILQWRNNWFLEDAVWKLSPEYNI